MNYSQYYTNQELPKHFNQNELENYFRKMANGDAEARKEIIIRNTNLIKIVLKRFRYTSTDYEDLFSVGLIGLIKSVDTYDTNKNILFYTYACTCIYNEIGMFLRKEKKYYNCSYLKDAINIDKNGKTLTIEETLVDTNSDFIPRIISNIEDSKKQKIIKTILNQLPEREKYIIMRRFGFIDKITSQEDIANELGLSQATISRIINRTIKKLKTEIIENDYDTFSDEIAEEKHNLAKSFRTKSAKK